MSAADDAAQDADLDSGPPGTYPADKPNDQNVTVSPPQHQKHDAAEPAAPDPTDSEPATEPGCLETWFGDCLDALCCCCRTKKNENE